MGGETRTTRHVTALHGCLHLGTDLDPAMATDSRFFWGLRLYLVCTPTGMPIIWAPANPKIGERDKVGAPITRSLIAFDSQ